MTSYSPIDDERASQANLLDKNVPQILSIDVDAVLKKHYTPFWNGQIGFSGLLAGFCALLFGKTG